MNKISCDICMDLIPLVKDKVASEDSQNAVIKHIDKCSQCRSLFNETNTKNHNIDDKKIISKIKKQLILVSVILVILGSFIGIAITESENMFYNILIMPTIGALSYFALRKKSYITLVTMFAFTYVYNLIKYIIGGIFDKSQLLSYITAPILWAIIYTGLCAIGILIGFLLYIALKKEKK
ncbi:MULTISPECIES: zf-HC2 domain-containing protein [unclassified Romboutsia]|uniref:zf-HC2 domain-containing protein n=1 Tax=unclassified Romboutsia TaxID=2626894 RepID=UPI0008219086|nr:MULTISPECIES: zf-HC2 domain-containing protein [unclassified Romboutsia]SCG99364.1 Uncharacterised protein [uncultured Clostridium sp.]